VSSVVGGMTWCNVSSGSVHGFRSKSHSDPSRRPTSLVAGNLRQKRVLPSPPRGSSLGLLDLSSMAYASPASSLRVAQKLGCKEGIDCITKTNRPTFGHSIRSILDESPAHAHRGYHRGGMSCSSCKVPQNAFWLSRVGTFAVANAGGWLCTLTSRSLKGKMGKMMIFSMSMQVGLSAFGESASGRELDHSYAGYIKPRFKLSGK
jgi:hypothetical protein